MHKELDLGGQEPGSAGHGFRGFRQGNDGKGSTLLLGTEFRALPAKLMLALAWGIGEDHVAPSHRREIKCLPMCPLGQQLPQG